MKIALAQLNYHTGNFEHNTQKIISSIEQAKSRGADLVIFAELAICGYPPRDFLEFHDFIEKCKNAVTEIATHCTDIAAIVGSPAKNESLEGKVLFNAAFFLANGEIQAVVKKALLPTYDVFDEYRYFEPNREFEIINYKGENIALTICEDIWDINDNPLYTISPMDQLIKKNPDFAINIAASPFSFNHPKNRFKVLRQNAQKYALPFFYVNHVGAQTELIFDGGSTVVDQQGNTKQVFMSFEEDFKIIDLENLQQMPNQPEPPSQSKYELIEKALVLGIKDYFGKLRLKQAILGLSGGIDSALVLTLAVKALGKENVLPVIMPSSYTSKVSLDDAKQLCENLDLPYKKISIEGIFNQFKEDLKPHFEGLPEDITEENLQARARAVLLMALSNKFGHVLLNTSNKSELAVGYGTLYGDMCGGLSVIGDVYKTEVFDLCRFINREKETIPANIIAKPPTAELKYNQKDTDTLPPYDQLDPILRLYIEHRKGPQEIIDAGFEEHIVRKVLGMINTTEYKRFQTPPILRISDKAFGMGRRLPIVAKYLN